MSEHQQSRGIGALALAFIPWALGLGAAAWLGIYIGIHQFRHELSQEDRAAVYVGAETRPKSKLSVTIRKVDCSTVTRADVDGSRVLLYARNDCHGTESYTAWHVVQVSPDGTVLHDDWTNWECPRLSQPGLTVECPITINPDDRASGIIVWTQIGT